MGNAAGSAEVSQGPPGKEGTPGSLKAARGRMPPEEEVQQRFSAALNTMNLPPDKVKMLSLYDNQKKWELICDQERFQVKNPPSAYLEKLRCHRDHGGVGRKFRRRIQESTQILRELEISLRTNHIGWAEEFLDEDHQGLDVLVDYLSVSHVGLAWDGDAMDNGTASTQQGHSEDKPVEDSSPNYRTAPAARKVVRNSRVSSQKDDVHLCIMCLRAIMNYQSGFNQVMKHPNCVNEITLSLNNRSPRTKALVLELLAAVCLVRGGHDIILSAFDNFKEVCAESRRFEKLMEFFCLEDSSIDFMVACMQFINIVVHSVENMNFRVHLQYEFTRHGLDDYLETLKMTESERLLVQIQAYLDNVFDVAALLEDAEAKNTLLEHMEELQESHAQLSSRLEEKERELMEEVSELEEKLLQSTKEVQLLQERLRESGSQLALLQQHQRQHEEELEEVKARGRDGDQATRALKDLEVQVQALERAGLVRLQRSSSGMLELQPLQNKEPGNSTTETLEAPPPPTSDVAPPPPTSDVAPPTSNVAPPPAAAPPPPPAAPPPPPPPVGVSSPPSTGCKPKAAIQTKYRLPLLNWQTLKSSQVSGTVFHELDEQHVLEELDMLAFEEQFKTRAQSPPVELGPLRVRACPTKVSLLEPNRAKNLAITLRKEGMAASDICCCIETYNQKALSLDFLELLERFIPSEHELKLIQDYRDQGRPLDQLSEEDRFMVRFSSIPRLAQRISTLTFMGNFPDAVHLIQPQLNAVIAASMSIKSSLKLKKILEIILAFGNYMNSSKRGAAYGFRLQSLDLLSDTKSTDRRQTLLHFIVSNIQQRYPELTSFYCDMHFLDRAALVSIDGLLLDIAALSRRMEATVRELSADKHNSLLQTFIGTNSDLLDSLSADGRTAQDVYESVVEYFGENSKNTPPSVFFPAFVRFIKAFKQAEQDNERRKKHPSSSGEAPPTPPKHEVPAASRVPPMDLISELKKRQVSPRMREGQDGAIEDIITGLRNEPFRRTDAARRSVKWKPAQQLQVSTDISL